MILTGTLSKAILLLAVALLFGMPAGHAVRAQLNQGPATARAAGSPSPVGTPARPAPATIEVIQPAPSGIASRIGRQQAAAQSTIAAYAAREAAQATQVARLQAALVAAQVTTTALVEVAAGTVLDPNRQTITVATDLRGMLANDEEALAAARQALSVPLSRYPIGCRAGFMLISGKAPTIDDGIALAERTDTVLRAFWPDIFDEATGVEVFALPSEEPSGEVGIDIFFYSGCQPIG